jgi:hypothetical protein
MSDRCYFRDFDNRLWITVVLDDQTMICKRVKKMTPGQFKRLPLGAIVRMGIPRQQPAYYFIVQQIDADGSRLFRTIEKFQSTDQMIDPRFRRGFHRLLSPRAQSGYMIERIA